MSSRDPGKDDAAFLSAMEGELVGWAEPAARLREALEYDHFRLYGQPVRHTAPTGELEFAEVLLRLREEEERMLPPGDFLPAFEHYRMMGELDRWVVRHALRRLGEGGPVKRLSINVSGQTMEEGGFAPFVAVQLRLAGVAPSVLIVEIDENDALDRRDAAVRFAHDMKSIGCEILLDGFARRSVSFEPLKALLADYVKVDASFVHGLAADPGQREGALGLVAFVHGLGARVIAEGVEDEADLDALWALGFDGATGRAASRRHGGSASRR